MIILAATPIGNLGDASPRLRDTFEQATVIAAEDTRTTGQLLRLLEIDNRPELVSLHEHNERDRAAQLVERAKTEDIVLVSDAGMPAVSDPGYHLVQ
ncbi:16S rRNA (cytidine(1402)-2'-O)-methyltransferase, partial [Leucobacter sp. M11]|uniref:16S rRNA (cytidine(1402)-2'-O)-methyltransferase n=1 Tax=Leucobacter sp. M11 TaxID=2993565 RepID=UPI002D7F5950